MDPVALARLQFAFTVAYHFLFVPISLGSGIFLIVSGSPLVQEPSTGRQGRLPVLAEAVHHHLRHRRGHRHHHGVRLRDQLGDLLPLRRRHLRRSAGRGGPLRLLPRIDLPRRAAVRPRPRLAPLLLRLDLAGGAGRAPLGLLDHHRQLLAADPGGLQGRGRARPCSPTSSPPPSTPRRCPASCTPSPRPGSPARSSPPASRPSTCAGARTPSSPRRPSPSRWSSASSCRRPCPSSGTGAPRWWPRRSRSRWRPSKASSPPPRTPR